MRVLSFFLEEPNDDRELPRRNMRRRAGLTLMRGSEAAFFNLCRLPDAFESPTWPCQRVINNAYVLTFYWGKKGQKCFDWVVRKL